MTRFALLAAFLLTLPAALFAADAARPDAILGEWSFSDGPAGWTPVNNAAISDVARRPGGKSLVIRQTSDAEADSAWLSPVLKNPGAAVRIGVWAADNYDTQKDFSYAAAFEIVPCDEAGKLTTIGGDWTWVPWEDKRQIPQFRHTMTREGLQWQFYEAVKRPAAGFFRVRLCWPKALSRGECYFTDVSVRVAGEAAAETATASPADAQPAASTGPAGRHAFEISTAANGNLFFADDPLRFEFLLYATDGQPVGPLTSPVIEYDITDYQHFHVASGTLPFTGAAPVTAKQIAATRGQNMRLSAVIPDAAAKETGREFFLEARLVDGGKLVATDTVTYGVVNPRPIAAGDYAKCRFIQFAEGGGFRDAESKHEEQGLIHKMGTSLVHNWDYDGWRKAQPTKGGPITIPPGPDFPKMVYCPNLEQVRGRKPDHPWRDVAKMAPDWAVIDDPFHKGCKGFDIDGYVDYIVAYVRANRSRIVQVVPSGLERFIDARTIELQRKAYAALKKEFPDLPVGMMTWGVNASEEAVNQILAEKFYEVADFFDTHVYLPSVDWTASDRLRAELKKRGIDRRLISTEFARVGGTDQLQSSRDMICSMLDAHAHGMERVTYFLMYVNEVPEAPRRQAVLRGEFPGDGFQWMQYVDRPRVSDAIHDANWGRGAYGSDVRGASLMPMLKTMTYYNFVQAVECAVFKTVFQPDSRSVCYVYARDGKTICCLYQREAGPPATLLLKTAVPYAMQDFFGRTDRVSSAGSSLVVATPDPLVLLFEGEVPQLHDAKTAPAVLGATDGGLALSTIARGTTGKAVLTVPPLAANVSNATITATVDGTWPEVEAKSVALAADKPTTIELPIAIAADRPAGSYTFTVRVHAGDKDGGKLLTVLKQPLVVGEVLSARLAGIPLTKNTDPAIAVTITSLADKPMQGRVRVANRFFGGFMPEVMEQPYSVAPGGTAVVKFPVPREQANLATSYEMRATVADSTGIAVTCEGDVSFQACVKTKTPIAVDGNLADWKLDDLVPIPFEKWHRGPREPEDFGGRFFSRWDDERLYFAAEITDRVPVVNGTEQVLWNDDNIMFCLYPWGWRMGEPLESGYYREHLGPLAGGKAGIWRAGNVPSGPTRAEGAEIAVTRTPTGWVYEWAYPKASLHPLALKDGAAFRLSMSVWDQFKKEKKTEQDWGEFTWLTFGGFNSSVNAQPALWREFTLVE
ncbi:MAG: hypothetical protein ACKOEX_03665 [Planctomycetia bacterium]